jgi:hypothetical protein
MLLTTDEVPMGRDWARKLVDHVDQQWAGTPLTFDERQQWGEAMVDQLDTDYAVCAVTAMKLMSPRERPPVEAFVSTYQGIVEEANAPTPVAPEREPSPPSPEAVTGVSAIERIRAENPWIPVGAESKSARR